MGMKVGDKVSVTLLFPYQGEAPIPFDATIYKLDSFYEGLIYVTSDSSGVVYRLDPTQYKTYD